MLVGDADAGLSAMLRGHFAPVLVEFAQKLGYGMLQLFGGGAVLLRVDVACDQHGSVLKCLNESYVIDLWS